MSLRSEVIRIFNELLAGSKKITELPSATTPLAGTELIEIVQDGENRKVASSAVGGGGGAGVQTIVAGTNITVDDTDPQNPIVSSSGGGSSQDLQSVLDEGSTANIGNAQSSITAQDGSNYSQWSLTPSEQSISSSDNGNTEIASFRTSPDGLQIEDTRANRGIQGTADYSANIEDNDFTQKVYVDAAITAAIAGISAPPKVIQVACSDETTSLTSGIAKITFRMPYAMTLTAVRASLTVSQYSGNILTVDINNSGSSILSTKLTIDNMEETSTTAATPAVISSSSLADDAEITIDIDQVGDGTAKGLKVTLIGE